MLWFHVFCLPGVGRTSGVALQTMRLTLIPATGTSYQSGHGRDASSSIVRLCLPGDRTPRNGLPCPGESGPVSSALFEFIEVPHPGSD